MKLKEAALLLAGLSLLFAGSAATQEQENGYLTVRTVVVKTGHGPEFTELLGKLGEKRSAAGHNGVNVWEMVRGPMATYYIVENHDTMADAGQPFESGMSEADWQQWVGRITSVVDHSTLTTLRTHPALAIPAEEDSPPNMMVLRYRTLKPGSNAAYHTWLEDKLVPALIEGGMKGWNISKVAMGEDPNTWISARRIDSWEQLDEPPPLAYMNQRRRAALLQDADQMTVSNRMELIRHRPELSY
ncbi:MAG: hypothetical protein AAGA33_12735 [Pseudomonadota bacterium]